MQNNYKSSDRKLSLSNKQRGRLCVLDVKRQSNRGRRMSEDGEEAVACELWME